MLSFVTWINRMTLLITISGSYLNGEGYLVQVYWVVVECWVVVELLHCLKKEKRNY